MKFVFEFDFGLGTYGPKNLGLKLILV